MPAAGVPLNTPVAGTKLTPEGKVPVKERVGVGSPLATTVKLPAIPSVKLVLSALVMEGGWLIVMLKFCVALGNVPFAAVTVPANVPEAVGVPERIPADVRLRPGGRVPAVTEKVMGVVPVAVYVWL